MQQLPLHRLRLLFLLSHFNLIDTVIKFVPFGEIGVGSVILNFIRFI